MSPAESSFWSELSNWDWVNIVGVFLVLVGVVGEVIVKVWKTPPNPYAQYSSNDPNSRMPLGLFFSKSAWERNHQKDEEKRHFIETIFSGILIIGLLLELSVIVPSLKHSWRTTLGLRREITELTLTNAALGRQLEEARADNLKLEKQIQPRRITPEQREIICQELSGWFMRTKCNVRIECPTYDLEARIFQAQLAGVLSTNGFKVVMMHSEWSKEPPSGVSFLVRPNEVMPNGANAILNALARAGVISTPDRTSINPDATLKSGDFGVNIGSKPID